MRALYDSVGANVAHDGVPHTTAYQYYLPNVNATISLTTNYSQGSDSGGCWQAGNSHSTNKVSGGPVYKWGTAHIVQGGNQVDDDNDANCGGLPRSTSYHGNHFRGTGAYDETIYSSGSNCNYVFDKREVVQQHFGS